MSIFLNARKSLFLLSFLIGMQLLLISLQIPLGGEENYFEKGVFFLFAPIKHGAVAVYNGIGGLIDGTLNLFSLEKENAALSEERIYLRQENFLLKNMIRKELTEDKMRDLLLDLRENILMARVIGLDYGNFYKSVIINKGTDAGILKDMVVLDPLGQLVGRVSGPISLMECRVQLITDIESGISVYSGKSDLTGILAGSGQGLCLMKHILSTDEGVQVGQIVYTAGFDGIYPPNVPVGLVLDVVKDHTLFKTITVRPLFNFRRLDRVAVIKVDVNSFH